MDSWSWASKTGGFYRFRVQGLGFGVIGFMAPFKLGPCWIQRINNDHV